MSHARGKIVAGDIGGTHARFAVVEQCDSGHLQLHDRLDLQDPFESFAQALQHYLDRLDRRNLPSTIVLAVAGPVVDGSVRLTNRDWQISERELRSCGFAQARLLNDFAALALAADRLQAADTHWIGPEIAGTRDGSITILGAGTGFGVSCLARGRGRGVPMATEGGHIGFAPDGAEEIALLKVLAGRFGRVSVERILSGPGLENISRALEQIAGLPERPLSAADIVEHAARGDAHCRATLSSFCSIFGAVAGDLALAHGACGGVLIAGGIAAKIEPYLNQGAFRARFEAKGRLSSFVKAIPTRLIVNQDAALIGAVRALAEGD